MTDDPSRYEGDWLENVVASVEGGVTCVQYRDTESDDATRYARAKKLQNALRARGVALVVNNDVELAKAIHADGVHVGQGDMAPRDVRRIVGDGCEIGFSITAAEQLDARRDEVAASDCLGVGPVFDARKTKADASDAMGLETLGRIVRTAGKPCVAIGGITPRNAAGVLAAGVSGIAVVSAFSKSRDPYESAREFSMLFDDRRL